MSNKQNTQWLEAAKENFEGACQEKDWKMARSILQDLNDKGFLREADQLARDLDVAQTDVMEKTGAMTIDDHYGQRMIKLTFGKMVPHIRLTRQDAEFMIQALQEGIKQL